MDTGFLSLPMTAGRRDIAVAEDDAGNPVYMTPFGQRYTIRRQNPAQGSRVKAGLEVLKEASKAPLESLTAAAQAMAQGTWDAISAPGRSWSDSTMTYGDVANTAGLVSLPAVAGKYDPAVANMGIRAYHGSPHDFDRFDMSKIGTGEGAQAYGHGLYFAEAEDVARQYRDDLSGGNVSAAKRSLTRAGGDIDAAIQRRRDNIERLQNMPDAGGDPKRQAAQIQINLDAIEQLTAFKKTGDWTGGRMYEVDINADPADFLDWDAPLSEQTQGVRTSLGLERDDSSLIARKAELQRQADDLQRQQWADDPLDMNDPDNWDALWRSTPEIDALYEEMHSISQALAKSPEGILSNAKTDVGGYQGEWVNKMLAKHLGGKEEAAKTLREAGIPGIKYYDQGSRASGQGTRNYVVFDDSLIEILRKYGVAGLAPLGATLAGSDQAQY